MKLSYNILLTKLYVLQKMRNKNRAIILMTNNVEEAEIVGDRIVIINDARVQTAGTLSQIRSKFRKSTSSFRRLPCLYPPYNFS